MSKFLAVWCSIGFEQIHDITAIEKNASWAKLSGSKYIWPVDLGMIKLYARRNRNRAYEIYLFDSPLTKEELTKKSLDEPQSLVDSIRLNGECVYSDYVPETERKIK